MSTFRTFEDIEAWKNSRELVKKIYEITDNGAFARDFGLKDQIRRASVSIMANISEGFERSGNKEFIQFLSIAKGSVGEVRSHLYVAHDLGYISKESFDSLADLARDTSTKVSKLMLYLQNSSLKGSKFK